MVKMNQDYKRINCKEILIFQFNIKSKILKLTAKNNNKLASLKMIQRIIKTQYKINKI